MPFRGKRKLGDFDPTKSDSDDETYGTSVSKPGKSRSTKSQGVKPTRKKPRRPTGGDDSEEDSMVEDTELSVEVSNEDEEDEEVEIGPTGRPKRKAAKKQVNYDDSDEDEIPEDEIEPKFEEEKPRRRGQRRSLLVTLNITPHKEIEPPRRNIRPRSGSAPTSRPTSSHLPSSAARRSSRIAHDDTDPVLALTNSGHHVDIVRQGTRSPGEDIGRRMKGGKGLLKKPPASVVDEETEESLTRTKKPVNVNETQGSDFQAEIAASHEDLGVEGDDDETRPQPDTEDMPEEETVDAQGEAAKEVAIIPESGEDDMQDDYDEDPISKPQRTIRRRHGGKQPATNTEEVVGRVGGRSTRQRLQSTLGKRKARSSQRGGLKESSDFEPEAEQGGEEDISDSEGSANSPRKISQYNEGDESSPGRRGAKRRKITTRSQRVSNENSDEAEELADELDDLAQGERNKRRKKNDILFNDARPKTRRQQNQPDYRLFRPEIPTLEEDDDGPPSQATPSRKPRAGGAWQRSLFSTYGPFGGAGGPAPVLGGPGGIGATAGADSDSSDDEIMQRPRAPGLGGLVGMTPTAAHASGLGLFQPPAQVHGADPLQGTPANLGKVKEKSALADVDPLGVDMNISFDAVGGLQGHIDQLKEMVALPLLYPEIFQRFHVTPPRGVLFHGPPGTGKTLLARALANSVSSQGRKVTFYMRKGADALSKWVGEAEKQLRQLFEEARKNQPSIIFFDEIDGLAPVRSSKQEQIHSSIVSTLLALMDGMDGRGQVIVIGATNRPDSVDPALRRPGRFDREFYFPLPNLEARRAILDIHTKGWDPPLDSAFKDEIAHVTKGYGGADLRALCTEAALNAVQRRYPQIYKSNEKLLIKPETINVAAKDFMISVKKMVPSSERSASSGAAPLPSKIEPLLRQPLREIENMVDEILPQKKRLTALQEAEFEDAEDDQGMKAERMQQEFERSRVFRPRLLIEGVPGMGQQYLAGALLNHFEGLHVQAFDLPTLLSDSTRSSEAAIVQLFTEVKRHKPSVIYIPNVNTWYQTVGKAVISIFLGLLRSLAPTDPVLLLGILESEERTEERESNKQMNDDLFGYSRKNVFKIRRPENFSRREFFSAVIEHLNTSPADFPDPAERKKRKFEILIPAPPEPPKEPPQLSKQELKNQKRNDRLILNQLKLRIQPIMDQIKLKFKKFRTGVIDTNQIKYLYEEEDPSLVTTDLPEEQRQLEYRPYEKAKDSHGEPVLREVATGKIFYNLETVTIEKRLSNGYYKRPKDFVSDVKKLTKDAKAIGDEDRLMKANELQANVEVDVGAIESENPPFMAELENVHQRELKREKGMLEKDKRVAAEEGRRIEAMPTNVPPNVPTGDPGESTTDQSSGPIVLGQLLTNGIVHHPVTPSNPSQPSTLTNGPSHGLSDLSDIHGQSHSASNGTSGPSRGDGDTHLTISEERPSTGKDTQSSFGPSAQTRPFESYTGGPASLQQRRSIPGSLSQVSAVTPMAEGSQLADYTNYASTTSSDKRHTGSSGDKHTQNTQSTNGPGQVVKPDSGPDLSMFPSPPEANSQIPDTVVNTQGSQSSLRPTSNPSSQSQPPLSQGERFSQHPTIPPFPRSPASKTNISSLLNDPSPTEPTQPQDSRALTTTSTQHRLIIDQAYTSSLLDRIVEQTSGCSVEQLEQVYSELMNEIWKTRGVWDRGAVAREVWRVFKGVVEDIRDAQGDWIGSVEVETERQLGQ